MPVPKGSLGLVANSVDIGAVRQLEEQLGTDELSGLVKVFLGRAPGQLANLRATAAVADAPGLRAEADSLKGRARSLGAAEIGEVAARIEHDTARGSLESVPELLDALDASLERTRIEMAALSQPG